jgi:hypothetical protein
VPFVRLVQVAALMQLIHAASAPVSEKLCDTLDEKLERLAVPEPIEQRARHVVSLMPVSHMQMCMHAVVRSLDDGPLWLELHAGPISAAPAASATAIPIQVIRMTATYAARRSEVQDSSSANGGTGHASNGV